MKITVKSLKRIIAESDLACARLNNVKKDLPECKESIENLQEKFYLQRVVAADKIGRKHYK